MGAEPSINRFPEALLLRDLMRVWDGDKIAPGGGPGRTAHALPPVFPPSGCDWKEFLRLVRHHGVAHPVRQAIDRLEEGLIPPGVVRSLEQNIFEVRSYNILLLDRLGKVARHFERERPLLWDTVQVHYDVQNGRYLALGLNNRHPIERFNINLELKDFTPEALRRMGRR